MAKPKMPRTAAEIRRAMTRVNLTHDELARAQVAALLLVAERLELAFDLTGEVARLEHKQQSADAAPLFCCTECRQLVHGDEVTAAKDAAHPGMHLHDDCPAGPGSLAFPIAAGGSHG